MNINKIKKKYSYKETEATVIKIIRCLPKEGFVIDYDKDDAIYDLRSDEERYGLSPRIRDDYSDYEIYDKVSRHADNHDGFVLSDEVIIEIQ